MKDEPKIVKILKEEEKLGILQEKTQGTYENLQMIEKSADNAAEKNIGFVEDEITITDDIIELEDIKETYRTIFDNYAIGVTLADKNERIISWNKYAEELLNMNEKELFEIPVRSLYPREEWKKIRAENVRKKGIKYRMETKMIRKDQGTFDVELSLCILKGVGGITVGSVGIIKDITKLKVTEKELKESEKRYKTIFENSAVAIMLTDENERIISWNGYTETLFGKGKDELLMKPVKSLYPTEEWEKIRSANVRQKGMQHRLETKILRKDNEPLDVDISLSVLKDNDGKIIGSIGVIKDISERKKTEKELKASEKRYRTIFENSAVAITHTDENERIISWNNYTEKLLGMNKNELSLKPVESLYPPEEWKKIRGENIRQKGIQHHLETKILRKNKEPLDVDISLSVIKDNKGEVTGSIGVIRDISERKEVERRLNSVMEYAGDSIYLIDRNYRYLLVNNELVSRFNLTKEQLLGKTIRDLHSPEKAKEFIDKINLVFENGKPIEDEHTREDNKWFLRTLSPVKDYMTGQITAVLVISKDITELKKTEKVLSESKEKFRVVLENSLDMIYQLNIKINTYDYVSPSSIKVLGYEPEEIIAFGLKKMNSFVHQDDQNVLKDHFRKLTSRNGKKETIQTLEYRIKHKNLGYRWVSDIRSVLFDEKNNAIAIVGNVKDITEQKKVWDELVKSEEKYRVLAETSADGVFTTDVLGRLTYINPSFEKLTGRRKSQILATSFKEYLSESSVYSFQQAMVDIRKNNQKIENIELGITHGEGYEIPVEANIAPLKKDGDFVGIECTIRDISEREKVVRELKKSENLRTEFMNIAAHELKSPVTPIKGYLELIESDKDVDEKIRKWAKIALRNAERLLLLVNDILDVSRLDTDTMRFNMEKIDSVQLLENAAEDIKPTIENKDLKFIKEISKDLPEIFADKYRLSQVLKNLLGNSIKFTDYGSISLKAKVEEKYLVISVVDSGVGISSGEIKKIFTKLYQAYTGEDRKNEGAGLGLYICKQIIKKHKGIIWAESTIGKGSTFTIKLPI